MSAWQVETTDLTELSAVCVRAGDKVKLTFDALPDLTLVGKVLRIKGFGENRQGDIVYKVKGRPFQQIVHFVITPVLITSAIGLLLFCGSFLLLLQRAGAFAVPST
jgi:hypothetical protein